MKLLIHHRATMKGTIMALTKKQEQELRAAAAEEARIEKLRQQLAEAEAKVADRANKRRAEIQAQIDRKLALIESKRAIVAKAVADAEELQEDIDALRESLAEED